MRAKIFVFLLFLLLGGYAYAGPQKIKVGFFASSGYHEISDNGEIEGYIFIQMKYLKIFKLI